jgi:membrane-bound metal-dependent hydrolase YbcI (DUF457 family)
VFLGHFAAALAAKRVDPRTSLGSYAAAAQLCDLAWPVLLLAGVERVAIAPGDTAFTPLRFESYPYSHSLLTVSVAALVLAAVHYARQRRGPAAAALGALVLSHWVLDFVTHRPDLPLWPGGSTRAGLGLWRSVPATLAVEFLMAAVGVALYVGVRRRQGSPATWRFWIYLGALVVMYLSAAFGPPPPSVPALAWVSLAGSLLVWWADWIDRPRFS